MDIALSILAGVSLIAFLWAMRELRRASVERRELKEQRAEFKALFELGDAEYKKAQDIIQGLMADINNKDIVMTQATQALDVSGRKMEEQAKIIAALDEKLRLNENNYNKLLGQKKSSEVRTGKIAEQIAPFLEDYPKDPNTARFIGDPIDFVHFDEDKVTFVEVKSGKSQLSKKQRHIRDLIADGKVEFELYRIKGE